MLPYQYKPSVFAFISQQHFIQQKGWMEKKLVFKLKTYFIRKRQQT